MKDKIPNHEQIHFISFRIMKMLNMKVKFYKEYEDSS